MHVFQVAFYGAGAFYALFMERSVLVPFAVIVVLYMLAPYFIPGAKSLSTRKKIMMSSWGDPCQSKFHIRIPIRTQKVQKIIESSSKQNKLTMTHFCVKALGQVLSSQSYLNGLLTIGSFIQEQSVNININVNIDQGKDLTVLNIKGVNKMSVEDIAKFINGKVTEMKKEQGGKEHKENIKLLKILPAFLHGFCMEVLAFFVKKLNIKLTAFQTFRNTFGCACVSSLGSLGFEDAVAPFTPLIHWTVFLVVNKISRQPVVEDDKVTVGNVMNCNFTIDHRYIEEKDLKQFLSDFTDVFENPQKYMDQCMKNHEKDSL